jgi:magnesium chelatase family protein
LLDRFDMHVDVTPVDYADLSSQETPESSAVIRERVEAARERQKERFAGTEDIYCNAMIPDQLLREYCHLEPQAEVLLKTIFERYGLSARAHSRLQKVALTSADLHGSPVIRREDIAMAVQFRGFDSKYLQ